LNLRRFFNYLYFWLMTHVPQDQVEDVEFKLNAPGPGRRASALERERDAEQFMQFAGALGVKPPK